MRCLNRLPAFLALTTLLSPVLPALAEAPIPAERPGQVLRLAPPQSLPGQAPQFGEEAAVGSTRLHQAVRDALATHPGVRAANARLDAAQFGLSSAEWGRYPSLQAEMSRSDQGDVVRRAQITQPVWAGGRISGEIDAGTTRVEAATAAVRETELTLAEQIVQAAVELQKARVQLARARESLAGYQTLAEAIERRAEGGLGLQSDVTLARSRIAQAGAVVAQFEAAERRAQTRWTALTGQPSAGLVVSETTAADTASPDELLADARAFSPVLVRLQAEAQAAGHDADVTKASVWPQLSLRAIRTWQTGVVDSDETQYLAVLEYQPGAGLGMIDRARAAYAQKDVLIAQIARAERDLEEQIRTAHADREGFVARVAALGSATAANTEIIESFRRQYNIGKRSWLDVLNAQREWTDSVQLTEESRYSALAAAYRLAVLSGRFFRTP